MLQPSTLTFLRQLKRNNNKPWFDAHKDRYLDAKADFEEFVGELLTEYSRTDPSFSNLQVRDCVFRIYKDVRFSKDKTPYKTHLSASFSRGGRRSHLPGYYLSLEPGGNSFCGGGIWMPEGEALKKIRQEIDYNLDEFESLLSDKTFMKIFGKMEDENALSRPPKGYEGDNPAIGYLKMKSYIVGRSFDDAILSSPRLLRETVKTFAAMKPLIGFLNKALD